MEKVITIDGKKVTFKANGATPIKYRMEFGRDYFSDIMKISSSVQNLQEGNVDIDMSLFTDIIYLLAKSADKDIVDMLEFYESFEEFPVFDVFAELQPLLIANMHTNPTGKTKKK